MPSSASSRRRSVVPRAGLTEERVVEEAECLADEVGLSNLTLAALADRLGVRQPSLYKHIAGMDALQRSIAIRAKVEMTDTLARAAVGRWRGEAIAAVAQAYRIWAHSAPGPLRGGTAGPRPG